MKRSWLAVCGVAAVIGGCGSPAPHAPSSATTPTPTPAPTPTPPACVAVCSYAAYSQYDYIAIAYSISRRYCANGWTPDYTDLAMAKKQAMGYCKFWDIYDCEVYAWGHGGVAAVASDGRVAAGAWAAHSGAVAEQRAVDGCNERAR
jgi:hypothetical protein